MIKSLLAKILFIIGIIIILVLFAWAIISFVPSIFSSLANVGSSIGNVFKNKDKAIEVTVNDNELTNNEVFDLAWDMGSEENGFYTLSYECADGLSFDIMLDDSAKRLICNTPFTLPNDISDVKLKTIYEKKDSYTDTNLIISFTSEGDAEYKYAGKTKVTIKNDSSAPATNGQTSTNSNGDLSAAQITSESTQSVEYVENSRPTQTYQTYTASDLYISDIVSIPNQSTVQFTIGNRGGSRTGQWQFSYTSPTIPRITEVSPIQPSLAPGQALRFTLSFSEQNSSSEAITINIDPINIIKELSESNNSVIATVTGRASDNGNNNNDNDYNYRDDADLQISNLEVGRISGNRFVRDDTAEDRDDVAIRFVAKNIGGESTGTWRFEVKELPYDSDDTYRSDRQTSLRPGESREVIVELDNVDEGDYDIEVELDSEDDVDEERENNNEDSVELEVEN